MARENMIGAYTKENKTSVLVNNTRNGTDIADAGMWGCGVAGIPARRCFITYVHSILVFLGMYAYTEAAPNKAAYSALSRLSHQTLTSNLLSSNIFK